MSVAITPGSRFASYRVEALVGRGGMGVVYRATDLALERRVALKLIAPELADDERFRGRFLKESRLAASLDHPNVIPIYDAGERDGQLYLAMRYVEGSDLKTMLERERERKLAPERALRVLAQIAGALDAAHRRGLVHRDVKPANVLLDEDEHAYLTDFGISKHLGRPSTDTGQMVGTLDYLAPEQIRGDAVDGRSDCYALACVLYECLAGAPPFQRESEAETLWAHLQGEPAPLRGYGALDPVLRKGLAKDKDERPTSCAELIHAAQAALGLATPAAAVPAVVRGLLRRHRAILAAALLVLAAAVAAIVALTGGDGHARRAPVGNGVAVIDPAGGEVASFIESPSPPSNVAVGAGAVWVLNTQDKTVSRLDPQTRTITRRLRTPGVPTDIAAGEGALWIGNGGVAADLTGNYTVSISRIDPKTGSITRTVKLPDRPGGALIATFNWGFPDIAVGAGAVWALNPDHTVSRIDPDTGKLVATIDVDADKIAAGREGIWFLKESVVTQIDPRTNRVGQKIRIGTRAGTAIAVGAGKIWVTAQQEGVVWRIEPGPSPVTRTIDVGVGVTYITFGAGAVWTANYVDGTVARIDPHTNEVTARVPIGAAQALAAGDGSAWVSTAGRPPDAGPRTNADAIRLVLRQHGFRAGRYTVGYRSCDDSTAQTGNFENRQCAANANAYAQAEKLVAVIGPQNSYCAQIEIPTLNRAPGGPLAMISPTNSYAGLTRSGGLPPPNGYRGEPEVYYPTGVRNYVRLLPGDDLLAVADAVLARRLGLQSVYVVDDGSDFGKGLVADPFRRAAKNLKLPVAGSATFDPSAASYASLANRIARSGAEGVVVGGSPFQGGDRLLKALRARLGARATIMAGFFFAAPVPEVLKRAGSAAHGVYVATNDLPRGVLPLTAAGRRFARDVGTAATQALGVMEAGQAAELVLNAIAHSDGTRASVLTKLRASQVKDGILGSFRFDRNGDITTASIPILRITGATPPSTPLPSAFQGAVVDTVVKLPASLAH
jgi:ABC-type branched-subunit amino acid transport system substrate-binding protein/tRNA A-37 threonylcarbamoyl transferase component Bud32